MKWSLKWASHTELKKLLVLYICILVSSAGAECSVLANLTSTKCEEPGYAVGQYPRVSTELEQVVRENIGEPEAEPVREKKKKKVSFLVSGLQALILSSAAALYSPSILAPASWRPAQSALIGQLAHAWTSGANNTGAAVPNPFLHTKRQGVVKV